MALFWLNRWISTLERLLCDHRRRTTKVIFITCVTTIVDTITSQANRNALSIAAHHFCLAAVAVFFRNAESQLEPPVSSINEVRLKKKVHVMFWRYDVPRQLPAAQNSQAAGRGRVANAYFQLVALAIR